MFWEQSFGHQLCPKCSSEASPGLEVTKLWPPDLPPAWLPSGPLSFMFVVDASIYIYIYIILCGWREVGWGGGGWLLKLEEHVTRITLETCQAPVPSRPVMKYPEGGTPQSDQERLSSSLPCGRARGSRRRGRWRSTTSGGLGCLARALGKRTGRARARPQS